MINLLSLRAVFAKQSRFKKQIDSFSSQKIQPRNDSIEKILLIGLFMFLAGATSFASAEDAAKGTMSLFYKGNISYKDGDYQGAVTAYEKIISRGKESGNLYYNLANSYFKLGNLGKTVVNYERARRLMPRDSDLESNYGYALSQIPNDNDTGAHGPASQGYAEAGRAPLQMIGRLENAVTVDGMSLFAVFLYIILGVVLILGLILKWPEKKYRIALIVCAVFLMIQSTFLFHKIQTESHQAIILTDTDAKFEPRAEATTYFKMSEGSRVNILSWEGDWCKVIRPDGKGGWVKKDSVEKI